ncbi:FMN-binding negative transcriptional regulator [Roseibium sp.]|uniref:FMN-binding negative transcriptional regulator n=1 Tax=Roseibium sp. TaxID=1936156 RepID=UPI003A983C8C
MYTPEMFVETDPSEVAGLIEAHPLAVIVTNGSDGLVANHIPVLSHGDDRLIGHIALANDMHRTVEEGTEILLIFRGEDAYISPNWYLSKKTNPSHVPTWNYQVVHVYGRISFQHDEKSKRAVVGRLTKRFETETNGDAGWKMSDAPRDYMEMMLSNIVAFEIEITRMLGKSKLSQNRQLPDFLNVASELDARGAGDLSERMKRFERD